MFAKVTSLGLSGLAGYVVQVEADLSSGLPQFTLVGLPDSAVKESSERVRSAVKNLHYPWPSSRITINLAPADVRKTGPVYDLPLLVGLLAAQGVLPVPAPQQAFLGELGLDGTLRPVTGVLPMALAAVTLGVTELFLPGQRRGAPSVRGRSHHPGRPRRLGRSGYLAWPRYGRCARPGRSPPCAGDRRRRRAQLTAGRPAGHGQKYAGQAPAGHPAAADL